MAKAGKGCCRMTVICNPGSSKNQGLSIRSKLEELFHGTGKPLEIVVVEPGDDITQTTQIVTSRRDDPIVAAGGDGTVSAVASALVGSGRSLGILPCGRLNHFARDLQIPLKLDDAVHVLLHGKPRRIDAAEVNRHIFVNNSSVGVYSAMLRSREKAGGIGIQWVQFVRALWNVLWRFPILDLALSVDGKNVHCRTPLLFIGNNEYQMERFEIGTRTRLDAGRLSVFVAHATGRLGLLRLGLRALRGRLHTARDFDVFSTTEATLHTQRRHLSVAMDGEVARLQTPLHYRTLPGALNVIAPNFVAGAKK